jgi:aldose 1-epimerase
MEYLITTEHRRNTKVFILRQENIAEAIIVPEFGNNLIEFGICHKSHWIPVLEPIDFDALCEKPTSYGNPILFPYPNRIRNSRFQFEGHTYILDEPGRHGLVRDKQFKVDAYGASENEGAWLKCSLNSESFPTILRQYPFPFILEVTYTLRDSTIEMLSIITNTGNCNMPLGFGIHPYFRRPMKGTIQVPAKRRWELFNNLPTGRIFDVEGKYDFRQPTELDDLILDDVFTDLDVINGGLSRCVLDDKQTRIRIIIEFDATFFRDLVVYTPPLPRQSIAIEPYTCPPDALNLKDNPDLLSHLILLPPGNAITLLVRFIVNPY